MTADPRYTAQPDALNQQAQGIRDRFRQVEAELTAPNSEFTEEARTAKLAAARETMNAGLAELQAKADGARRLEQRDLESTIFGPPPLPFGASPSDRIVADASYRDARDRARATEPTKLDPLRAPEVISPLVDMLNDAITVGDKIQARAVLAVAMERGDVPVLNAYTARFPEMEAKVDRLYEIRHATPQATLRDTMAQAFALSGA